MADDKQGQVRTWLNPAGPKSGYVRPEYEGNLTPPSTDDKK